MKLVIVESPAKCKTIKKYLGDNYQVMASLGHIRDLATSGRGGLGVDVDNGFTPTYVVSKSKINVINELKAASYKADEVILATDPDREGEAIAWHLAQVLNLDVEKTKRMEFHEITRDSISQALNNLRTIDLNYVASQETRRILDRIIGFKLSTLLYRRIHSRSAGRVQSAVLKLVSDHEKEILEFVPEEYWNINTKALINGHNLALTFVGRNGKSIDINNKAIADEVMKDMPKQVKVVSIKRSIKIVESNEPFTTSTLQQEAFNRLKFKTKTTQSVAQSLYEGIDIGTEHVGLITYMRVDSTRLAPSFVERANAYILDTFGKEYLGSTKKSKKNELSQDAHEAIRPTSNHRTPDSLRQYLTTDQYNLYKLIYNRTLASLMKPKKEEVLNVILEGNGLTFQIEFSHTLFKGFEILYKDNSKEKDSNLELPNIQEGQSFDIVSKSAEQKFTSPPSHYSEAKLVKLMEEEGIGRPSTYSSTIETLRNRKYVSDTRGVLTITEQGSKTSHVLEKYFPTIVDTKYTANMEEKLDYVQDGSQSRVEMLDKFYKEFMGYFDIANKTMYFDDPIPTGDVCPECGAPLVIKEGKNGKFVGCSNYPTCRYVQKEEKETNYTGDYCPECGKPLVFRTDKKGKIFVACSGYPKCKHTLTQPVQEEEHVKICPQCGGYLIKKKGKYGSFLGCTNYPKCNYMEKIHKGKRK